MLYWPRKLESEILRAAHHFPSLLVCGPRRSGKTTLLQHLFPRAQYVLLEEPDIIARVQADPRAFLDELSLPVILDEIQNTPELLAYVRARIDRQPNSYGRWLLTGSQEAPLMRGVTESLAGRVAVFDLLPFSSEESDRVSLLLGGFPEVLVKPTASDLWFRSYVRTYLERDVRAVTSIRDLATFRRFLGLLVARCGQMLNKTDLAAPLGVSVPTISQWVSVLEVTGQILLIPPYYENFGKRMVKTPKLYFMDSGLAAFLLGIRNTTMLRDSPFRGALFEGFVASEIAKHRINRGQDRSLYYFRDRQGLEVDFVVDVGNRGLLLIEAKATRTPRPEDAASLLRVMAVAQRKRRIRAALVYEGQRDEDEVTALCPGVRAVSYHALHRFLDESG